MKRQRHVKTSKGDLPFYCTVNLGGWREFIRSLPPEEQEHVIDRLTNEWRKAVVLDVKGE